MPIETFVWEGWLTYVGELRSYTGHGVRTERTTASELFLLLRCDYARANHRDSLGRCGFRGEGMHTAVTKVVVQPLYQHMHRRPGTKAREAPSGPFSCPQVACGERLGSKGLYRGLC